MGYGLSDYSDMKGMDDVKHLLATTSGYRLEFSSHRLRPGLEWRARDSWMHARSTRTRTIGRVVQGARSRTGGDGDKVS